MLNLHIFMLFNTSPWTFLTVSLHPNTSIFPTVTPEICILHTHEQQLLLRSSVGKFCPKPPATFAFTDIIHPSFSSTPSVAWAVNKQQSLGLSFALAYCVRGLRAVLTGRESIGHPAGVCRWAGRSSPGLQRAQRRGCWVQRGTAWLGNHRSPILSAQKAVHN